MYLAILATLEMLPASVLRRCQLQNDRPFSRQLILAICSFLSMSLMTPAAAAITDVQVKSGPVRIQIVVSLTEEASYRVLPFENGVLRIDFERSAFDFVQRPDLAVQSDWITTWSYGYLLRGFSRITIGFDRAVLVSGTQMTSTPDLGLSVLTVDLVEAHEPIAR